MKRRLLIMNFTKLFILFSAIFTFSNAGAQIEVPKEGCLGKEIAFTTKGSGTNFNWDFGQDATTKDKFNSETGATFTKTGKYTVTLTYTSGGRTVTETVEITIKDCCVKPVGINLSVDSVCLGSMVGISGNNVGAGYFYNWSFGSGSSSATSDGVGTHYVSYNTTGNKTITLTVGQTCKCGDCPDTTITKNIYVKPNPTVSISGPSGCLYINTGHSFTGSSDGTMVWSAGDGAMSGSNSTKTISWSTPGAKTVCITSTLNGCSVTECLSVNIIDNSCPTATINGVTTGCQFSPIGISAVDQGFGVNYSWDFGAGVQSVSGSTNNKSVTYNTSGTKTIRLIVSKCGCTNDTSFHTIVIKPTPVVDVSGVTCGVVGTNYVFSSVPSPLSGVVYSWNTGGGTGSSTNTSITSSWSTTGAKSICLTSSLNGCSSTDCHAVSIVGASCPTASFNIPSGQCGNTTLSLSADDQGYGTVYTWTYNGSTYTGKNVSIILVGSGSQAITLTVNNCNCANSVVTKYISVSPAPNVALTGPTNGFQNIQYTFTTPAVGGATYYWTVDGVPQASVTNTLNYTWSTLGFKSVCVTTTVGGCSSTDCLTIGIILNTCPEAIINTPLSICQGSTVTISAVDQGCFVEYDWLIAGVSSSGITNHVTFNTPGSYEVRLIITPCGCTSCPKDTAYVTITVKPMPTANIAGPTVGEINTPYSFITPANSGATYAWNNGGGVGSSTTNTISITWSSLGLKTICVDVTLNGCTAQDCHNILIENSGDSCANPAILEFKQLNVGVDLNDTFIVDGGNTVSHFYIHDYNNTLEVFETSTNYVRNGLIDTTAYTRTALGESTKLLERVIFNHAVNKLEFSIFDLDYDSVNASKYIKECVEVNAFNGASVISLNQSDFTLGSFMTQVGPNKFCNTMGPVNNTLDFGDIDFHFLVPVDSVHIFAGFEVANGYDVIKPDFGLSDIKHCSVVPVPVTWLNIVANRLDEEKVLVNWSTASEINNDHFEIERSVDGSNFEIVGTMDGKGNTSSVSKYSFIDPNATANNICYRIKQVDFNGDFSYSRIECTNFNKQRVDVYPNPSNGILNIVSSNVFAQGQVVTVYDVKGTKVHQTEVTEKTNSISLDLNILEGGIYFVSYNVNGVINISKIVLTK